MSTSATTIFVLNGPNLNLLGTREPEVYGAQTLQDVAERLSRMGNDLEVDIDFRQTNHEGELIDWLHEADKTARGIILNPGGLTHTSVALRDAVAGITAPVVEVHISNVFAREDFRHHSFISAVAAGTITGMGTSGYDLALSALATGMIRHRQ